MATQATVGSRRRKTTGKRPAIAAAREPARLTRLKAVLQEISDIGGATAVLGWDQATYMPRGGAAARGRQIATLGRLSHERFTSAEVGRLLDGLAPHADSLPPDSDDAALIRVTRKDYEKAIKVPPELVAKWSAHGSASYQAWTQARPANDFASLRHFLEKSLDHSREYAELFRPFDHIADPLIDGPDEGMNTATVKALFDALRTELVPIVRAIGAGKAADDTCLRRPVPEAAQLEFGLGIAKALGYDLERGRQDKTHHPFCTKFSIGDVRITTRINPDDLGEALFSTLHEAGHAMYEQGVSRSLEGTGLASGTSAGVHESQSRLWENIVGRSRGFWQHYYPQLQRAAGDALKGVPLEAFYRAINKVERSLIRTAADEVTYNLHIMLRFDLELDMLEGRLAIRDLPEAWRARYQADLGVTPPDDKDGCLQDVHWFGGGIGGAFQSYTIGNVLSAQFYEAACRAHPSIPADIAQGRFDELHGWLRDNIYVHGRKLNAEQVVMKATGRAMTIEPYIAYLRGKYGELHKLPRRR